MDLFLMRRYEDEAVDEDETNVAPRKSEAEILADLKSKFEKKRKKKLEEQAEPVILSKNPQHCIK